MTISPELEASLRAKVQRDARQAMEVRLLDDGISLAEYRARRAAKLVMEPAAPLDEMSYRDYRVARDLGCDQHTPRKHFTEPVVVDYRKPGR